MAIVRFLDKNKNCYQIDTPMTPILIYLTSAERQKIINSKDGECLVLVDVSLSKDETSDLVKHLNTTDDPRRMN